MEEHVINVEPRNESGKGASRKVRQSGRVPGILYGRGKSTTLFSFDPAEFHRVLRVSAKGRNTLFRVKGAGEEKLALIKEVQTHPARRNLVHIDFYEVGDGAQVEVKIPIEITGKPQGVQSGGALMIVRRYVRLWADPKNLPEKIEVDVSSVNLGETVYTSHVVLPAGTRLADNDRVALALVRATRADRMVTPGAGEEAGTPEADKEEEKK